MVRKVNGGRLAVERKVTDDRLVKGGRLIEECSLVNRVRLSKQTPGTIDFKIETTQLCVSRYQVLVDTSENSLVEAIRFLD